MILLYHLRWDVYFIYTLPAHTHIYFYIMIIMTPLTTTRPPLYPYLSIDIITVLKNPRCISSDISDPHMIKNFSVSSSTIVRNMLILLLVEEMLLLRYLNCSSNSTVLLIKMETVPFCLKQVFCLICIRTPSVI